MGEAPSEDSVNREKKSESNWTGTMSEMSCKKLIYCSAIDTYGDEGDEEEMRREMTNSHARTMMTETTGQLMSGQ